jgi:hypothetical protein
MVLSYRTNDEKKVNASYSQYTKRIDFLNNPSVKNQQQQQQQQREATFTINDNIINKNKNDDEDAPIPSPGAGYRNLEHRM